MDTKFDPDDIVLMDSIQQRVYDAIIQKYGDITKDCKAVGREHLLKKMVAVARQIKNVQLQHVSRNQVRQWYSEVAELEEVKIDVKWLHERLDKLAEFVELRDPYQQVLRTHYMAERALTIAERDLRWTKRLPYSQCHIKELEAKVQAATTACTISECEYAPRSIQMRELLKSLEEQLF